MHETELWITRIFNDHLGGVGNAALGLVGMPQQARPWADFVVMQFVVVLLLMAVALLVKSRLSVNRPGPLQQCCELLWGFVREQAEEQVGHEGHRYAGYFATIFIFILVSNLIGLIPAFASPTQFPYVTAGCALATFCYYHIVGLQALGLLKYLAQFAGPMWWLAPLMFPIEIVSHLARPLSLTVRLFANMFAGEQVTMVFLKLTYLVIPVVFMGLHLFVGVVQAYIFMLLTMVYVGGATSHEH